jgi:hypothetical protein
LGVLLPSRVLAIESSFALDLIWEREELSRQLESGFDFVEGDSMVAKRTADSYQHDQEADCE